MSSSNHQHQSKRQKKGVRFAPPSQQQDPAEDTTSHHPPPFKKRKKNKGDEDDAWNGGDDDEDDIEKWNNKTEDDEEYQKVLQAKRKRRLDQKRRRNDDDDHDDDFDNDPTVIDQQTSLGADDGEEIAIEPFHMKQEEADGSGYFDGDTYVFRRAKEEEPDAWLDMLDEQQADSKPYAVARKNNNANSSPTSSEPSEDANPVSRSELIGNMIPFVSDTETVVQALVRYGNLLQATRKLLQQQQRSKQQTASSGESNANVDNTSASTMEMAQSSLNTLTESSNELMLEHGMVDVYQLTRKDLLQLLSADEANGQPSHQDDKGETTAQTSTGSRQAEQQQERADTTTPTDSASVVVQWEYMGNEDGQVHGPFSTADMLGWTRAGYFVGDQAVQVRSLTTTTTTTNANHATLQEDLLADLMDDDEEDRGQSEPAGNGSKAAPVVVLGEWLSSNQVDFASHA